MKFVTKQYDTNDLTLGMLLHCIFENQLRFDKVKASLKVGTFWGHSVNANWRTASLLFSVLDFTYEMNGCDCSNLLRLIFLFVLVNRG